MGRWARKIGDPAARRSLVANVRGRSASGLAVALPFYVMSLTPSLIPRTWLFQAVASGVSLAAGYALGTFAGWLARLAGFRPSIAESQRRRVHIAAVVITTAIVVTFTSLGAHWQGRLHVLFGFDFAAPWYALVVPGAFVVAILLVLVGRGLSRLGRLVSGGIGRAMAASVAVALVGVAGVLVVTGVGGTVARDVAKLIDGRTEAGIDRPQASQRSGSAESVVSWGSLGVHGQRFAGTGPTADELGEFAAEPRTPIRAYAGLRSAGSITEVAGLVVDELDRTDAWSREVLVVVSTTGSGWVDPAMADAVELMFGGDTAIAAMQYTYLPSWASLLTDGDLSSDAGRVLFEAVHDAWSALPPADRPKLYVFGESLGAAGGQDAFGSLEELTASVDGALWAGSPNTADMWQRLTAARDRGSGEATPVVDGGRVVRWSVADDDARDVLDSATTWERPRVLYLQHPSDVVTWWTGDLLWSEPDWLREPPGHDVLPELRWLPGVTFWQLTFDVTHAANSPSGHGHKYWLSYIDAWVAIASPDDWTDADRQRLYEIMTERAAAERVIISGDR